MARHPDRQETRERNAARLSGLLGEVEGVLLPPHDPAVTTHGRHLFIFRVPELGAAGKRDAAVRALSAEGLTDVSSGYVPLHRNQPLLAEAETIAQRLGQPYAQASCPAADEVSMDTIWLPQRYLLGTEEHTARIATAIAKVVNAAGTLT